MDFYIFYISQGNVATQLRCGGIFSNHFIMNFPQNAPVRKFWQSVNIWQRYWQNFVVYFFGLPCIYYALLHSMHMKYDTLVLDNLVATDSKRFVQCIFSEWKTLIMRVFP